MNTSLESHQTTDTRASWAAAALSRILQHGRGVRVNPEAPDAQGATETRLTTEDTRRYAQQLSEATDSRTYAWDDMEVPKPLREGAIARGQSLRIPGEDGSAVQYRVYRWYHRLDQEGNPAGQFRTRIEIESFGQDHMLTGDIRLDLKFPSVGDKIRATDVRLQSYDKDRSRILDVVPSGTLAAVQMAESLIEDLPLGSAA